MKQASLALPELGIIVGTRAMLAAGAALLLAEKLSDKNRRTIGWSLIAIGVLTTVPLAKHVIEKLKEPA
jgi:hypothetical protein